MEKFPEKILEKEFKKEKKSRKIFSCELRGFSPGRAGAPAYHGWGGPPLAWEGSPGPPPTRSIPAPHVGEGGGLA